MCSEWKATAPEALLRKVSARFLSRSGRTNRPRAACRAVEAGADGIIVSNHGGRVLPFAPSTAEVLPEIVDAVKGQTKIIVDGGIRSGADMVKALALGADAVLICRPFAVAWFGGGSEGVRVYIEKLRREFTEAMYMCGARKLSDLSREMIRL